MLGAAGCDRFEYDKQEIVLWTYFTAAGELRGEHCQGRYLELRLKQRSCHCDQYACKVTAEVFVGTTWQVEAMGEVQRRELFEATIIH